MTFGSIMCGRLFHLLMESFHLLPSNVRWCVNTSHLITRTIETSSGVQSKSIESWELQFSFETFKRSCFSIQYHSVVISSLKHDVWIPCYDSKFDNFAWNSKVEFLCSVSTKTMLNVGYVYSTLKTVMNSTFSNHLICSNSSTSFLAQKLKCLLIQEDT